jgi:hypothetical protein
LLKFDLIFFSKRVLGLQSSDQDANAAQTLFRWSFLFGLQAYTLWSIYFLPFYQYPRCPEFPVLLTCFLGAITNAVLLVVAISKAPVVGGVIYKLLSYTCKFLSVILLNEFGTYLVCDTHFVGPKKICNTTVHRGLSLCISF